MFSFFEKIINPYPPQEPAQAPNTMWAFCRHYTQGMGKPLILMSLLTAMLAAFEVYLFGFMGQLVDWLIDKDPKTLWQDHSAILMFLVDWLIDKDPKTLWQDHSAILMFIGFMLLIGMPLLSLLHSLVIHQTLMGNMPMSIRWKAHRYLLKQSMSFYENEFAGRIATKVMQTSLAVRESVMKLLNVMIYILVYFSTMVL